MKLLTLVCVFCFQIQLLSQKNELAISEIIVDEKPLVLNPKQPVVLKAGQNDIVLTLKASLPPHSLYHYKLTNFHKNWQSSQYPIFHFMNLEGGMYLLEIKANNKYLQLPIEVNNALWQKWWFWPSIAFYVITIVGTGAYLFFLYNFRQKLKLQAVRNKIASDLHDEVGSNLNSISIYTELLRKKTYKNSPELAPILEKVISSSKESVGLMRDTVWAINPLNDDIAKLFERMKGFATEILGAKDMEVVFEIDPNFTKLNLSMDQRKDIYLIFKEAINNIAKHAKATEAQIHLKKVPTGLQLCITDNGVGFESHTNTEGNGLRIFKERAQQAGFELDIDSQTGQGTQITVLLPVI